MIISSGVYPKLRHKFTVFVSHQIPERVYVLSMGSFFGEKDAGHHTLSCFAQGYGTGTLVDAQNFGC